MQPSDDRDFLIEGANAQDTLLQSYRSIHVTLQSILLALGVGVSILPLTLEPYPSTSPPALVAGVVLLAIWGLHLFSNAKLRAVVYARGQDVNYWHLEIIKLEQQLDPEHRYFTAFKVHQQSRRKDVEHLVRTYLTDHKLDQKEVQELIGKGLGHTRRLVDQQLFMWIAVVWVVLVVMTWGGILVAAIMM